MFVCPPTPFAVSFRLCLGLFKSAFSSLLPLESAFQSLPCQAAAALIFHPPPLSAGPIEPFPWPLPRPCYAPLLPSSAAPASAVYPLHHVAAALPLLGGPARLTQQQCVHPLFPILHGVVVRTVPTLRGSRQGILAFR